MEEQCAVTKREREREGERKEEEETEGEWAKAEGVGPSIGSAVGGTDGRPLVSEAATRVHPGTTRPHKRSNSAEEDTVWLSWTGHRTTEVVAVKGLRRGIPALIPPTTTPS